MGTLYKSACTFLALNVIVWSAVGCSSSHKESKLSQLANPASPSPAVLTAPTPLPSPSPSPVAEAKPRQKPETVKGIYVSAWSAAGSKFNELLRLLDTTELNAMVIDLKNDSGQITYNSNVPLVKEIGANSNMVISDIQAKLRQLKEKQIYTIGRVVVFKDPYLSGKRNEFVMKQRSGKVWKDKKGISWVDPFKKEVWEYNAQIAKEAAELGFDEIQFDYVRFPENGKKLDREVAFDNPNGMTKSQAIESFLKRSRELVGNKAFISADVFGLTTSSNDDMGIGQEWPVISQHVDFISPMLYPSHYSKGIYGVKNPDLQPYAIIKQAVADAKAKNEALKQTSPSAAIAGIRPWYQDFTATWIKPHKKYTAADVREQIKAAKEQGVENYLLWNSTSTYTFQ